MIAVPEIVLERVAAVPGRGEPLAELALAAARRCVADLTVPPGGVIAATFSNPRRFPSLAVEIASALGLPDGTPAFDVQMACSAYPYALYLAGRLAADTGRSVLVIDGDVQSPFVDPADHDTGRIFSDAATATLVSSASPLRQSDNQTIKQSQIKQFSCFDFLSRYDAEALSCPAEGPLRMQGFRVFSFVATEVSKFLRNFIAEQSKNQTIKQSQIKQSPIEQFLFAPHQANPYMIRQLAKSLGLSDRLLTLDEKCLNPGSCSIPMTLAAHPEAAGRRVLVAGFGAGYSAAAGMVRLADGFQTMKGTSV